MSGEVLKFEAVQVGGSQMAGAKFGGHGWIARCSAHYMDAALTHTDLTEITEALNDYESVTCWAIRVVDADDSFDIDAKLPRSRVWVDGEPTNELVDGTCGIALINGRPVVDLAPYIAVYGGDARLMLIGGTSERCGNDAGELILQDAYCYWTKLL